MQRLGSVIVCVGMCRVKAPAPIECAIPSRARWQACGCGSAVSPSRASTEPKRPDTLEVTRLQQTDHELPRRHPGSHAPANVLIHKGGSVDRARVARQREAWSTDEHTMSRLIEALKPGASL
ncbi:hypothetical protein KRMM14A1004_14420 [Krasilnikovia sp. MM14-A1004]